MVESGPVTVTATRTARAFRVFDVTVARLRRLGESTLRVTLTGPRLDGFADNGLDQRIKLVLPLPDGEVTLADGPQDWYAAWLELPVHRRNPLRTYTARAVRQDAGEVDVDVVLHGGGEGPAARWARSVRPGDALAVVGPDARHDGEQGGIEFRPPPGCGELLLAGDESAAPAVAAILERLPARARGTAVLEVPTAADVLPVPGPEGVRVVQLPRDGRPHGSLLVPAAAEAAPAPGDLRGPAYAWLAGEAGAVTALRRQLVGGRGWPRAAVTFRGYWRAGAAEA
jgi:NADPH-dependent ferric siderophore reductase